MLQGIELIDCAKANAKQGLTVAAQQCGYGDNISLFRKNLIQACQEIGVDIEQLSDLVTDQQMVKESPGTSIEIAPDSNTQL